MQTSGRVFSPNRRRCLAVLHRCRIAMSGTMRIDMGVILGMYEVYEAALEADKCHEEDYRRHHVRVSRQCVRPTQCW